MSRRESDPMFPAALAFFLVTLLIVGLIVVFAS
jgi:hypothetical protein